MKNNKKSRLKIMIHLILNSYSIAKELLEGMNHWAILSEVDDDHVILMEFNTKNYFK